MRLTIFLCCFLFASSAMAEDALNTVTIQFENERQPTADAGVGPGMDVARDGEYLFMLQQRNLVILSVKDPAGPVVVGKLEDVGNLRQIVVRDNVAYITARADGLFVVDVSDPTAPKLLSHYDTIEFATGIALKDQFAFVAQRWFGVEIIDISNPAKLRHVSVVRVGEAQSCLVSDGYMYFTGMVTDLHIFESENLVRAISEGEDDAGKLKRSGDFHDFEALEPLGLKNLATYRPRGQVYAAVENNGLIYAACGSAGIHVLDENLVLQKQYPTRGVAMDVQVHEEKLYAAQGSEGLVRYEVNGPTLERMTSYETSRGIRQVRVAPNGRFAVVHAGGAGYEILDVSDSKQIKLAKHERGWGGLVYYRQLCNGFIDGEVICGTWCAGRTFMSDLGAAEPANLPDPIGLLPDMKTGGYAACGEYALLTRDGGYSIYKPLREGEYDSEIPVYRVPGGPAFRGKPTVRENILVACDRIDGDVTVLDINDLKSPQLIRKFKISGNPDLAFIGDGSVLIPAGRQGLIKFDL